MSRTRKIVGAIGATLSMAALAACGGAGPGKDVAPNVAGDGKVLPTVLPTGEGIVLLLDGWSAAGIDTADLTILSAEGERKPIQFRPATGEDLRTIAGTEPEAVRRVAARMYSADPNIVCDAKGCRDSKESIDFETLAKIGTSPVHGSMYQAWGIENGAWVATIPDDFTDVWYGTRNLTVMRDYVGSTDYTMPNSAFGKAIAISISFGQIYPTTPLWLESGVSEPPTDFETILEEEGPEYDATRAEAFLGGLHADVPDARGLGAGVLTWMSSPTTGCGSGVLCVPGIIKADTKASETQKFEVCSDYLRGVIEQGAIDVSYTFGKPIHQFGAWGGSEADGNRPGGVPLWRTTPPYAEGVIEIHYEYAHLYDRFGLRRKAGRVSIVGEDSLEDTSRVPNAEDLSVWFGGFWQVCDR